MLYCPYKNGIPEIRFVQYGSAINRTAQYEFTPRWLEVMLYEELKSEKKSLEKEVKKP